MCFSLLHSGLGLGSEDMTLELAYRWSSIKEKKKKKKTAILFLGKENFLGRDSENRRTECVVFFLVGKNITLHKDSILL